MNRHTAGKWIVTGWKIGKTRNQFKMTVTTGENIAGSLEMQENVNLFESVHDLLEALELADAALTGANMDMKAVKHKVKAAIARARGEA